MNGSITRRRIMAALGVGSVGVTAQVLAACGESTPTVVTKEVPVEKTVIKEVPVEKIVEKVVVKEVPVEKIVVKTETQIKEVPVDKIVIKEVPKIVEKTVVKEVVVEAAPAAAATTPIRFMNYWAAGTRWETMKAGLEEFDKRYPNIQYKLEKLPPGFYRDKVNIMFAAGTIGDVLVLNGARMREFASMLLTLNDLLGPAGVNIDDYLILAREYPDKSDTENLSVGDALKGMPFMSGVNGWVYNVDKFEADGVANPTADATWDSQLEDGKKMSNPDTNHYGFHNGTGGEFRWLPLISANGGWLFTDKKRPATASGFNTTGGREAFQWYVDVSMKHKAGVPLGEIPSLLFEGVTKPFATGKIGMEPTGIHGPGGRKLRVGGRFTWDNMPSPKSPIGEVRYSTNELGHFISHRAEDHGTVETSMTLISFIAGEYFQGLVADGRGAIPMFRSVINSDRYLGFQPGMPKSMNIIRDNFLSPDLYGLHFFDGWAQWWNMLHDEMTPAITGEMTAMEAMANAAAACDKHLKSLQAE